MDLASRHSRLFAAVLGLAACLCGGAGEDRKEIQVSLRLNGVGVADDKFDTIVGGISEIRRQVQSWPVFRKNAIHLGPDWWLADAVGAPISSWEDLLQRPPELLNLSIVPEGRPFQPSGGGVGEDRKEIQVSLRLNGGVVDDKFDTIIGGISELRRQVQSWQTFRQNAIHLGPGWWLADAVGAPISSWEDLLQRPPELLNLSIVPEGRHFQWGVQQVHDRVLVPLADRDGVVLEPVSKEPRVFVIHNLFSEEEATFLINNAENLEGEYALGKSGVGLETTGERETDTTRTSNSAFDVFSPTAVALSKRIFDLARVPWDDDKSDGLQVLRYDEGQAYVSHLDWFDVEDGSEGENLDTRTMDGTNRFATVVLYLQAPEEGGWTVFPKAKVEDSLVDTPGVSSGRNTSEAETARAHATRLFDKVNGWERRLVNECATRLAVKPVKLGAVLFYHQDPLSGALLYAAEHGGCPPFKGVKWGANMWIWNNKRALGSRAMGDEEEDSEPGALETTFQHPGVDGEVALEYSLDGGATWSHYDTLEPDAERHVKTYRSHVWRFLQNGQKVSQWDMSDFIEDRDVDDEAKDEQEL